MGLKMIHSCNDYTRPCASCHACVGERKTYDVTTSTGVLQLTRCGHCDGTDAHVTVRKR